MTMYKEYNTNQLSLELNLAYDIPINWEWHHWRRCSLYRRHQVRSWCQSLFVYLEKAINKYEESLNDKTAELYDTLVQEGVDLALSKEECETSEGLVHLLEDTEQALAEVEKAIIVKLIVQ